MKRVSWAFFLVFGFFVIVLAPVGRVHASLGGPPDSVESDRRILAAKRGTTITQPLYTVHEIASGGTVIREYVSVSGVVFGIAWNGMRHPDLTALLGSYSEPYQKASGKTPHQPGVRQLSVKADGVVVEKWGHVRDLQGRAYAPDLIPPGVNINEIK